MTRSCVADSRLRSVPWVRIAALCLVLAAGASRAEAQAKQTIEEMKEFHAGDLKFRTHVHLEFSSRSSSQAVILPPDGFSGGVFRTQPDGTPGWGQMLRERGFNTYMFDHVGCGSSLPPPSRDITRLTDKAVWGTFQIMVATRANLVIAQGFSAGFAIKGRSMRKDAGYSFALIDPIGPQGSQDFTTATPEELLRRRQHLQDTLWKKWGWGSRAGHLRPGTDLTPERAQATLDLYDPHQPNYPMTELSTIEAGTDVNDFTFLQKVPVLIVRTTAADEEQIRREEQVSAWLEKAGCRVDHLDLSAHESTQKTTGLPWAGDEAGAVLKLILQWYDGLKLPKIIPAEFQY